MTQQEELKRAKELEERAANLCEQARNLLNEADRIRRRHVSELQAILDAASAEVACWPKWRREENNGYYNPEAK